MLAEKYGQAKNIQHTVVVIRGQCVYTTMNRVRLIILLTWLCMVSVCHAQQRVETTVAERPKVALVLSGGGARGAAHVGVIRLIEEMQIPIDYVAGTSMGAIIGALYAIGYTADEMDSLLMAQDWKMLLSNNVPRAMLPYTQRMAEQRYQVNVPYTNNVRTEGTTRYRDAGIRVRRSSERTFPKVLARPGLIDGQNLLNTFSTLTIAYHDSVSYHCLPRPFACVATDMVTGNAVVLDHGFIAESMRASMSIPGVFYPVYKDSMVLVDGGVVNNYPVDVARDMGADIVIGVDLNTGTTTASELHSFTGIFERLIGTMGSELRQKNMEDTDILIAPKVGDFPVMGFDTTRLSQLVEIGYHTALQSRPQLEALSYRLSMQEEEELKLHGKNPAALKSNSWLSRIIISGTDRDDMLTLLAQYGIKEGAPFDETMLTEAVEHIYGLGTFSSVQYHLLGEAPYTLEMQVTSNPLNQVELGLRIDSEDAAAALFSIGINRLKLTGPKLDLTTRLSINPWVEGHAAYAWRKWPQVNATLKYWFSDVNRFYNKSSHAFSYHYYGSDLYLSNIFSRNYDLRLGTRYDYFLVHDLYREELPERSYTDTESHDSYVALYASIRNNLFNAAYLPTSGYAYGVEVTYNIKNRSREGSNFWALQGNASAAIPLGNTTVVQPAAYMRLLFGESVPFVYGNNIGGYLAGRYTHQQIPFVGITGCEFTERQLAVLRVELRQQLSSDLYLSGIANYAYCRNNLSRTLGGDGVWGFGGGLIYNTTVGPFSLYGHWNDMHHRFGAYFSFGYEF